MIAEQLKRETKSIHATTEKLLVSYIKSVSSLEEYTWLLQSFYGFLLPLEQLLHKQINLQLLPDHAERRKAASLLADLETLGVSTEAISFASGDELPIVQSHAQAMGASYVFEGSTLGGQAIVNLLHSRIDLPEGCCSFFLGYGANTGNMWQRFTTAVNSEQHLIHADEIAAAANDTFSSFHSWLQKTLADAAIES